MDVIWDRYFSDSIKGAMREKRGKGIRMKVASKNKIPGNWRGFYVAMAAKKSLFNFFSKKCCLSTILKEKKFLLHLMLTLLPKAPVIVQVCDYEEVDTRLLLHLVDALKNGCSTCIVQTVDTEVVV